MINKIEKRHAALLKKLTEQRAFIDSSIDSWKFTYPELALCVETKKRTIEKTLDYVTQALQEPESIESTEVLQKKLDDVESLFSSLASDFKPRWRKAIEIPSVVLLIIFLLRSFIFSVHCISVGALEPTLLIGDRVLINKLTYEYSPIQRGDIVSLDSPDTPYQKKSSYKYIWQRFIGFKFEPLNLPEGPTTTLRRVIAIPGDTIEGRIENGSAVIYLNDDKLNEAYVNPYPLINAQRKNGFIKKSHVLAKFLPPSFIEHKSTESSTWSTHVPHIPHEDQPFYKLNKKDILIDPKTNKPFLKHSGIAHQSDTFGPLELPAGKYWCLGDNRRNSKDSRIWGAIDKNLIRGKAHSILYSVDTRESTWVLDVIKDPVLFFAKKLRTQRFLKKLIED